MRLPALHLSGYSCVIGAFLNEKSDFWEGSPGKIDCQTNFFIFLVIDQRLG